MDVLLNELAQGLRPMSEGVEWFDGFNPEEQAEVLLFLRHHCVQARAVAEDAAESIRRAWLSSTHTPSVLISRGGRFDQQLGKIAGLVPLDERRKAFRLLIALLAVAERGVANISVPADAGTGGTNCQTQADRISQSGVTPVPNGCRVDVDGITEAGHALSLLGRPGAPGYDTGFFEVEGLPAPRDHGRIGRPGACLSELSVVRRLARAPAHAGHMSPDDRRPT
ncbi:DUF5958 family protein [Streptomyces sp. LN699]|uniref:DUF5958 family protein n=1 Tax=Streptomyces sp. LN699 TaxID=3112981 RepID=UPI00370F862C